MAQTAVPSLHAPSTEVPPGPWVPPTNAAEGQSASHPQAMSDAPLVETPKQSCEEEQAGSGDPSLTRSIW